DCWTRCLLLRPAPRGPSSSGTSRTCPPLDMKPRSRTSGTRTTPSRRRTRSGLTIPRSTARGGAVASIQKRPDGKWRARYRDADGREHSRHFARKIDGQAWLDEVTASVVTGMYVDPDAGKLTFSDYWQQWRSRQIWVRG